MVRTSAFLAILLVGCSDSSQTQSGASSSGSAPSSTSATTAPHTSASSSTSNAASSSGSGEPTPTVSASAPPPASSSSGPTKPPVDAGVPTANPVASNAPDAGTSPSLPPPAPGTADALAAEIDTVYLPMKTFKANFIQKYKAKSTGQEKESHGIVFVEKPDKISFRYDAPNKNRIVSDGSEVKVYIADDQQMFVQPVRGTEYPGALSFIMGQGLRQSFEVSFNDKAKWDKGKVLNGKPKVANAAYDSALFYVDTGLLAKKDIGTIAGVLIIDAQGNRNRFEFQNASMPDKIDPSEFTFTPPAGTNVQK